jgi:hypothetical protein
VSLAGPAAENFYWTTSYIVTSEPGVGTDAQLALAKKYGRDEKTANSHNYANGVMVAQVAAECILRAKAKGLKITKENLYNEMLAMNGMNAFYPVTTVGPVTYSKPTKQVSTPCSCMRSKTVNSTPWANRLSRCTREKSNNERPKRHYRVGPLSDALAAGMPRRRLKHRGCAQLPAIRCKRSSPSTKSNTAYG